MCVGKGLGNFFKMSIGLLKLVHSSWVVEVVWLNKQDC